MTGVQTCALPIYQRLQEETPALTINRLGLIYKLYGQLDKALFFYQKNLSLYQKNHDKALEGTTLNNISQIYDSWGDYDMALGYLEQSLKIQREIGDKAGEGTTLNNISQIYDSWGDYDKALGYLEQSLKIRREIGFPSGLAYTLFNLAMTCFDKRVNQPEKGNQYLAEVLEINKFIQDPQLTKALKDRGIL